jgi:uncharacterized protein YcfJ
MRNKGRTSILIIAALSLGISFWGCEDKLPLSDEKAIDSFVIGSIAGVISGEVIAVTVPYGTDITALSPVIEFTGNTVNPASGASQDFTNPVAYQIIADDGSVRDYTVIVRHALSDKKAIASFAIGAATGVIDGEAIAVTVPYGTNLAELSPVVLFSGASVSPASGAAQDFTNPATYRVTADDGSVRDYTVTVRQAASDEKAISSFVIGTAIGAINDQTISVTVPSGTDIAGLAPVIGFVGNTISPASGTAQDFANPVTYRVTADDGSFRDYTAIVRHEASDAKAIASFVIGAAAGVIDGEAIAVTAPYGTNLAELSPVILFDGASVSPASGAAQDFAGPVTYRVTADDGSVRDYVVTVQTEGRAPIEVVFASLPRETVDLAVDAAQDLSRTGEDTLRITVDAATARWFIDGEEQTETGSVLDIAALSYPVGTHHVAALIYKDEIPYSNEVIFKVVE